MDSCAEQPASLGCDDSALNVEGLKELFGQTTAAVDPTLLVEDALADLFPARQTLLGDGPEPMFPQGLMPEPMGPVIPEVPVIDTSLGLDADPIWAKNSESEIQRDATEFLRFAEQFHAFAVECQQR